MKVVDVVYDSIGKDTFEVIVQNMSFKITSYFLNFTDYNSIFKLIVTSVHRNIDAI